MLKVCCPSCGAKLECPYGCESVHRAEGEEEMPSRVLVRTTSYRRRLLDAGNCTTKHFIDALRYAGFLRDDTTKEIIEETRQVEVLLEEDERTEIELFFPQDFKTLVNKNRFT